jgi:hypothetical protein
MATVTGADYSEVPPSKVDDVQNAIGTALDRIDSLVGGVGGTSTVDFTALSTIDSTEATAFSGGVTFTFPEIPPVPVDVVLYVIYPSGDSFALLIPESEVSQLEGVTAVGDGTFSILSTSFHVQSEFNQTANSVLDANTVAHGLSAGSDSLAGADSLVGGGAMLTDTQAAFLTASATNFGANSTMLSDLALGLKLMSNAGTTAAADLGIEVVRLTQSDDANFSEVGLKFDRETLVLTTLQDLPGATLALEGMEKAMVLSAGTVRVDGGLGAMVIGDSNSQAFLGGTGNDTLVGGGGFDTMSGGAGADVFGFIRRGHYTITDFVKGQDKLLFEFDGVNQTSDIVPFLTGVTEENGNTTFHFGSSASITLVGVTAAGIASDLLFDV